MAGKKDQTRAERAAAMKREREQATRKQRNVITVVIVAVVVALIALAAFAIHSVASEPAVVSVPKDVTPGNGIVITGADVGGAATKSNAAQVVVYEDFLCPVCKAFEDQNSATIAALLKTGDIEVEYRPVAYLDSQSADKYSTRSANAALAVFDIAGPAAFVKMHAALYDQQPAEGGRGLSDSTLLSMAKAAGAKSDISQRVRQVQYEGWLAEASNKAEDDGVKGTPTVTVDGETLESGDLGWPLAAAVKKAQNNRTQ